MKMVKVLRTMCVALFALLLAAAPMAAQPAQPAKPAADNAPAVKRDVQVHRLKYAAANDVVRILTQLYMLNVPGPQMVVTRIAADPGTNAVLVIAPATEQENIEKVIKSLDVDADRPDRDARQLVRLVRLTNIESAEDVNSVQNMLRVAFLGRNANFAVDAPRRTVVLSGDRATVDEAARLLEQIQPIHEKPAGPELQIRIVWLANGPSPEGAAKPPADLADVTAELAKLGIDKPWLAAQGIVNATPNSPFQLDGTATLDAPCQLAISGLLLEKQQSPALEITIAASKQSPKAGGVVQLCNLRTTITTPIGHAVVLGVTPTEGTSSVFVVQVLRKETRKHSDK